MTDDMTRKTQSSNPVHRVAIVEDRDAVREHWATLIDSFDGFACSCACSSGEAALAQIPPSKPEIVLMDIFLPGMSGIECTVRLKEIMPECRVLILTATRDEEMVFPALEAGADGYLIKHSTPDELHHALLQALQGGVPMTSGIARHVAEFFRRRAGVRRSVEGLSQRETEVLDLIAKGYVNKEIAERLSLSVQTVTSYLKTIYKKMHVHSRAEAAHKYMTR
ncbi:MAG: response regulator transcription factor [Luteolibacter sp.]